MEKPPHKLNTNSPNIRLGILGSGQLARMLALASHPLGISPHIYAQMASDPAAQVVNHSIIGSAQGPEKLAEFLAPLDYLTFESEFVDIKELRRHLPQKLQVFPSLTLLEVLSDRASQKSALDEFKVPTSPWMEVNTPEDLRKACQKFPTGFVLKKRRFGYDGYGTFVFKPPFKLNEFISKFDTSQKDGFIAEQWQKFRRELAFTLIRSQSNDFVELPLVESVQVDSRCFSVCGPVFDKRLKPLVRAFKKWMTTFNYVGALAIELFDTPKGLMVNELAPRVHNSAHYSMDALTCSQFEYHVRAGLGLPLPKPGLKAEGFAMVNLLGKGAKSIGLSYFPVGHLHWYGKTENRQGRKLGHLNTLGQTPKAALKQALRWEKEFRL